MNHSITRPIPLHRRPEVNNVIVACLLGNVPELHGMRQDNYLKLWDCGDITALDHDTLKCLHDDLHSITNGGLQVAANVASFALNYPKEQMKLAEVKDTLFSVDDIAELEDLGLNVAEELAEPVRVLIEATKGEV